MVSEHSLAPIFWNQQTSIIKTVCFIMKIPIAYGSPQARKQYVTGNSMILHTVFMMCVDFETKRDNLLSKDARILGLYMAYFHIPLVSKDARILGLYMAYFHIPLVSKDARILGLYMAYFHIPLVSKDARILGLYMAYFHIPLVSKDFRDTCSGRRTDASRRGPCNVFRDHRRLFLMWCWTLHIK